MSERGKWGNRVGFDQGTFPQPLFQEQSSRSAIQSPASILSQTKAVCRRPTGGVLIDPNHRQHQPLCRNEPLQQAPVAKAMAGLSRELLGGIEWQPHHKQLGLTMQGEGCQALGIQLVAPPMQWRERCDRDPQGITAGDSDPLAAHIESQGGTGRAGMHSALTSWGGQGARRRFPLLKHGFQPQGCLTSGLGFLAPPDGASHQNLFP